MSSMFKISVLKKLDEEPGLFVLIPKSFDFDSLMKTIIDRFPNLKARQFFMFYRDSDDDKVMISTELDYRQFWRQEINKIFIVTGSIETSCIGTPPSSSKILSTIDEFMEHFNKLHEKFNLKMEEMRKCFDRNQETGSTAVNGIKQNLTDEIGAIGGVEVSSVQAVQSDERLNKVNVCSNNDGQPSCPSSVSNNTENTLTLFKTFTGQKWTLIGPEEIASGGSCGSAAAVSEKSADSPSLQDLDKFNQIHQAPTENVVNSNGVEEFKKQEPARLRLDLRMNEALATLNAMECKNEPSLLANESSNAGELDTFLGAKETPAAKNSALENTKTENPPPLPQQHQPGMELAPLPKQSNVLLNSEEDQSLIDHQCSYQNTDGKKCYTRQQIMLLREAEASQALPQFQDHFTIIRKNSVSHGKSGSGKRKKVRKSDMVHVELALIKDDVELHESTNASKPTILLGPTDSNDIDVLGNRVRGILNTLTPEKFESLLEQLRALDIDSNEKFSSVISVVFEKVFVEPNLAQVCGKLCSQLCQKLSTKDMFKKELLNKCQSEFNTYVANEDVLREKFKKSMQTELNETNDQNRQLELTMQLEEEERKLRRRSVGTVRLIGGLYRRNMILPSILEWCLMVLLNSRTEAKLECLCELLKIVGPKMERKTHDEVYNKKYYRDLTPHFQSIQQIVSNKEQSKISNRVHFMLMDVIKLRKNNWVPCHSDSNPMKMGQTSQEAIGVALKN